MATTDRKLTYADYMGSPEDHHRWEVIDGRWARTPFPGSQHQTTVGELMMAVGTCLRGREAGNHYFTYLAVILGPHDIYEPDVLVLSDVQMKETRGDEHPRGAPRLCVEITDDATRDQDRGIKFERYAHFGVPEFWIVDHQTEIVECYVLENGSYRLFSSAQGDERVVSPFLPDLELPASEAFREPFSRRGLE